MHRLDVHHHLINEPGYLENLLKQMDHLLIERVCLSGIGLTGRNTLGDLSCNNADVLRAHQQYPDRIIPIANVRLGRDGPDGVAALIGQGFRGVKTTRPLQDYDCPEYDEVYQLLEKEQLPVLFHTGIVLRSLTDAEDDVSSDRMRPAKLDRVARRFPGLTIIMAHLGAPWHDEAAMMVRMHPNVFADMTGAPGGWLRPKLGAPLRQLLYWPGAVRKLVFGTDVHWRDLTWAVEIQTEMLEALESDAESREAFWATRAESWWPQEPL